MKKILFLILGFSMFACAKQPIYETVKDRSASLSLTDVNVGTSPNDGTGQTIRSAFQTGNANNTLIENAFATVPTDAEMRDAIADSLQNLKEEAEDGDLIYFERATADAPGEAVTYEGMVNYVAANGGTGSGGYEWTEFIVGTTTGAPEDGDATFTISDFAGDVIRLDIGQRTRDSLFINEGDTNTYYGYRYNSSGKITVRPALRDGERVYIEAVPTSSVTKVTLSGGASTLLTGLKAYWDMDEVTGTAVNEYLDTYDGVTNATVGVTGKFGLAETFVRANSDVATFGDAVGDVGTSDFSIACWVYIDNVTTEVEQGIMGNWGGGPHYYLEYNFGKAIFYFSFGGGDKEVSSNSELAADTWIHLTVTVDRSGNATMYVNGSAQTDVESVAADVAVAGDNNNIFNVGNLGNSNINMYANFTVDEAGLWLKVLTTDEIAELIAGSL
jgi:hypothetical protein